jgi:hypothetical protein
MTTSVTPYKMKRGKNGDAGSADEPLGGSIYVWNFVTGDKNWLNQRCKELSCALSMTLTFIAPFVGKR